MPAFLVTLIARAGIPERFARLVAWLALAAVVIVLCWSAVTAFRGWIADSREAAVAIDRTDVTIEAANRVINATSAATVNQMERDDAFANAQEELTHEADTNGTADPVGPATASVLDRMREQQAAGRRGARAAP